MPCVQALAAAGGGAIVAPPGSNGNGNGVGAGSKPRAAQGGGFGGLRQRMRMSLSLGAPPPEHLPPLEHSQVGHACTCPEACFLLRDSCTAQASVTLSQTEHPCVVFGAGHVPRRPAKESVQSSTFPLMLVACLVALVRRAWTQSTLFCMRARQYRRRRARRCARRRLSATRQLRSATRSQSN